MWRSQGSGESFEHPNPTFAIGAEVRTLTLVLTPRVGREQQRFYAALGSWPVAVSLRTASDIITRATPLMIMLTPTSVPIAQAELDGQWIQMNSASSKVTTPSNSTHADSSRGTEFEVEHNVQHALDQEERRQQQRQ